MARASQRGPQRLVVNAERVRYRQKERVRTTQVWELCGQMQVRRGRRLRGRGGLPRDRNEGVSQAGLWSPCEVACLILQMTGSLRRVTQGNNMIKWAFKKIILEALWRIDWRYEIPVAGEPARNCQSERWAEIAGLFIKTVWGTMKMRTS